VNYLGQTRAGDRLGADIVLLAHDEKRFHVFVSMYRKNDDGIDDPVATAEHLLLHVETTGPRVTPADPAIVDMLGAVAAAHAAIRRPDLAGRHVGAARAL
jgi:carnitine 3-dehydrogenase